MKKFLYSLAILTLFSSLGYVYHIGSNPVAYAQGNPTCPTRPVGDSSNACASTSFVQTAIQTGLTVVCNTLPATCTAVFGYTNPTWYGASGNGASTTGSIISGSKTLTLAAANGFRNGDGIFIQSAGPATSVGSGSISAVTAINTTGGATTYSYKIASKSNSGGIKAATAATTITNGHATLGTYQSGISGIAMNQITWVNGTGSPLCTIIWRSKSGGAYQLLGCFTGTSIFDPGLPTQVLFGLPTLPSASDVSDDLVTTVTSGAGGTTVIVAAAASTTVTSTGITHEDTAAIQAAVASNPSVYFPAGTFIVRGLQLPSTLHSITGVGGGNSLIFSIAQTSDGFNAAVSSSMNGGPFYMRGMKIQAAVPMAYNGYVLHFAYTAVVSDSEFIGSNALQVIFGKDIITQGNQITGFWNIGIYDQTNEGFLGIGNVIQSISGQAGALALTATPAGSNYVWASGIVGAGGTLGYHHYTGNDITMKGGSFGIAAQSVNSVLSNNVIRYSGRECMVPGSILVTSPKVFGNRCEWAANGNGNLSAYDFAMSISDDGTHVVKDFDITGNTFINSAWGVGIFGAAGGTLSGTVTGNSIFGSNQILGVNNCGIELSGTSTKNVTIANNTFGDVTANMTYKVCEQDNGSGLPSNTFASLNIGPVGSSGDLNLVGSGSIGLLLPVHSGQLATLAGTESLSNKTLPAPIITGSITATGLVKNADLVNSSLTINGTLISLGGSATITGAPSGAAGGDLTGSFPNPTLAAILTAGGPTGSATVAPIITYDAKGRLTVVSSATITPAIGSVTGLGTGIATALAVNVGSVGAPVLFNGALGTPSSGSVATTLLSGTLQVAQEPAHTGDVTNTAGSLALSITNNAITLAKLATQATNTVLANATSGTAVPTALAVSSCSTAGSALIWTTNTGFGCNTSITAAVVPASGLTGTTLASGVTASSLTSLGTITSLTATTINAFTLGGTISGGGNQLNNIVIGTVTPLAGTFTTVTASTSITSPIHAGGSAASSSLTLESTSGVGTTDSILFKTASQTTRATLESGGRWAFGPTAPLSSTAPFVDVNQNTSNVLSGGGSNMLQRWVNADGVGSAIEIASIGAGSVFNGFSAEGTLASPTNSAIARNMHLLAAYGWSNSARYLSAAIEMQTAEAWSNSAGGSFIDFYVTPTGGKTLTQVMKMFPSTGVSIASTTDPGAGGLQINGQTFAPNITTTSAAQTGTVCWTTGTGKFTVDTTVGCLASVLSAKNITERLAPQKALEIVTHLSPFAFRYKAGYGDSGNYEQFGLGAEEVALVDERLVGRDPQGNLQGVRYQEGMAVLVGAIQQLKAQISELERRVR